MYKSNSGFSPLITLLSVLFVLVVLGYYVWLKGGLNIFPICQNGLVKVNGNLCVGTGLTIPKETPGLISDWKTYNNGKIVFKYPSDWKTDGERVFGSGYGIELSNKDQSYLFSIRAVGNYNQATGKEYKDIYEFNSVSSDYEYPTLSDNIEGELAYITLPRAGSESNFQVQIFATYLHPIYIIELDTPRDGSKLQEGKKIFETILSTFGFIEPMAKASSQFPASGVCAPLNKNKTAEVIMTKMIDNVFSPRCAMVSADNILKIVNESNTPVEINIGVYKYSLEKGKSYEFPRTVGVFLEKGVHNIGGAEIWMQ